MLFNRSIRFCFYLIWLFALASCQSSPSDSSATDSSGVVPPNILLIFTDDLGYGDLSCYGSPNIRTPNLDRLAVRGLRLTDFYAFPTCSPSRAALLTGQYPPRAGMPDVAGPPGPQWTSDKQYGLHPDRTTLAEILRQRGYATAMIGKWHLGHFPQTMPDRHGFDRFYGLSYSNDMLPTEAHPYPPLALLADGDTLSTDPDQSQLVWNYVTQSIEFIKDHPDQPFFVYLAHSMPHVPLYASANFAGRSGRGLFTDVVEEIDAGVGRLVARLEQIGRLNNTLIIFTSDNGPWLSYGDHAGSAGPFREGKGTTYEGGMRVPFLAHWPDRIEAGRFGYAPASLIDLLPTIAGLTGSNLPTEAIDGRDLSAYFLGGEAPDLTPFFYYRRGQVEAVRLGEWKLHRSHQFRYVDRPDFGGTKGTYAYRQTGTELYNLVQDPGERYDRAAEYPERVERLLALIEAEQVRMEREKPELYFPLAATQQ